ncbi:hypothetical protein FACS189479_00810 [Spirochaetia bacterium]|nr:hypothetical protein FACS189479_00810 [Spirochaetia bacterium]
MKKIRYFILVPAVLMMFTGATVWEGAAASAPRGDLPEEGYYAATNSFPRNTAVDITNLETGKSVRAIVSAGLENPGLLATLSREAAASIGLQNQSIGRIRMLQPSDPIAFSRFSEGFSTSGDPDYDPRAMAAAETSNSNNTRTQAPIAASPIRSAQQPAPSSASSAAPAIDKPESVKPDPAKPESTDYPYRGYTIVDVPNAYPGPALSDGEKGSEKIEDEAKWDNYWDTPPERSNPLISRDSDYTPESTLYSIWAQGGSVGVIDGPDPVDNVADSDPGVRSSPLKFISETAGIENSAYSSPSESVSISPVASLGAGPSARSSPPAASFGAGAPPAGPENDPNASLALLPAEQRPPAGNPDYLIPPDAFIAPIERPAPPVQQVQFPETASVPVQQPPVLIDEALFIAPIERKPAQVQPVEARPVETQPVEARPVETQPVEAQPVEAQPVETQPVEAQPVETQPAKASPFSVPVISELERGKYYLQLGAFSQSAKVEEVLTKIDKIYPLVVQTDGAREKPTYRILVGPVNQGEGAALLQRFKRGGFGDAFVKRN